MSFSIQIIVVGLYIILRYSQMTRREQFGNCFYSVLAQERAMYAENIGRK